MQEKEKADGLKFDGYKLKPSLVPTEIVKDIARVREYGINKYKDENSWKNVEIRRYIDALDRHILLFNEEPYGIDDESGLPHLWHIACNVSFLCELMKEELNGKLMHELQTF